MKKQSAAPDKKILTARIIQDDFARFLRYMPNPDDVASGMADSYRTYRDMKTDPRIKSLLNKLKTATLNYPVRIVANKDVKDEVMDFVTSQPLFTSKLYAKAKRMLSALDYGFSVTEMEWDLDPDGAYIPLNLITRKPERFRFNYDWECYWVHSGDRLLDDPYKWLFFHHNPDDENPYGTSDLRSVYWPWVFKKAGFEFWLLATEKFSVKTILALFEMSGEEDAVQARAIQIAEMLQGVTSGSGSALANIKDIKELGMNGSVAEFQSLVDACDVQIAYGLTGQSVATNNPVKGTQALGTVASDLLHDDAKGIALELQVVLQKAIDWTVALNFGEDAVAPTIEFDVESKATFDDVMKAVDHRIPVSKEALYSYYKIPEPKDEEDAYINLEGGQLDVTPSNTPIEGTTSDVQATALNGAQVTSLVELAAQASGRTLPIASAKAIARASFPLVDEKIINAMFDPIESILLSDPAGKKKARPRRQILILPSRS